MKYQDILTEDRRLLILTALEKAGFEEVNEIVLTKAVRSFGHRVSLDTLRVDLSWLAEQELVEIEDLAGVYLATITDRGREAAKGVVMVPGVKRP